MFYVIRLNNGYISKIIEPQNGHGSPCLEFCGHIDNALKFNKEDGMYTAIFFHGDLIRVNLEKVYIEQLEN